MNIKIVKCDFERIRESLLKNISDRSSPIDSFLESHILKSNHYEILLNSNQIGYFSIFNNYLLTQFYVDKPYIYLAQEIFDKVRRYEKIEKAFVYTGDEFFLSHAIDYSKKIDCQAYFFQDSEQDIAEDKILTDLYCRVATENDIELILEKTGDFFDDVVNEVKRQEIFIGYLEDEVVSFGIIEKSELYNNIGSIGMFTVSKHRQTGIGRNTLLRMKQICYKNGLIPIAGCWYYNHNSKKTLQSAGMFSQTRLLVFHF